MEQGRTPGRAHRRRRRASKARSRTLYERAVESGLKTPRPRRRKLGRRDEAYLGPRPWCSAMRPGPLASWFKSIATARGHPTASVSARGARGSSGPWVEMNLPRFGGHPRPRGSWPKTREEEVGARGEAATPRDHDHHEQDLRDQVVVQGERKARRASVAAEI